MLRERRFVPAQRPHLPLGRILEMNLGFLGLQFSFGLQQGNMAPIYSYLGANESQLPMLQLAGPLTGLLIQPLIGALSDRTTGRGGRRTPFFRIGAVLSLTTILWSIWRVPELPLAPAERAELLSRPSGFGAPLMELAMAIRDMPRAMRKLGVMSLFQWFGMSGYWTYATYSIGRTIYHTADPQTSAFHSAVLTTGEVAAFYNAVAFVGAFAMVPFARRIGPGPLHALALAAGGLGMIALPLMQDKTMLFIPAIGVGLAWGSIMGNPYTILTSAIPAVRTGVYMGIFNMMIVLPMLLFAVVMSRLDLGVVSIGFDVYHAALDSDPRNMLRVCGACLIAAALAVAWVEEGRARPVLPEPVAA